MYEYQLGLHLNLHLKYYLTYKNTLSFLSDLINNPLKLQYMEERIKQLNLQYKMSEHVKRIIRDVYI